MKTLDLAQYDDEECTSPDAGAVISPCKTYRYRLWRHWGDGCMGNAVFIMLNPSTAGEFNDDPTIRKCVGFARRWKMHGIRVVNLFALRATNPRVLVATREPVGPHNDLHLRAVLHRNMDPIDTIICAWGAPKSREIQRLMYDRITAVREMAGNLALFSLGQSQGGWPRHPLMLGYDTPLERFEVLV